MASPEHEIAASRALLTRVARGEIEPLVRLYRPGRAVAFGRLDALTPRYERARSAAAAKGFTPLLRTVGGHAAAFTEQSLVYESIVREDNIATGIRDRFEQVADRIAGALKDVGIDARVGALPGEYCAGDFSVNGAGRIKLAGIAQRRVRGAALISAIVMVGHGALIREVLVDVYRELAIEWDPATAGAVTDLAPDVTVADVQAALSREGVR